MTVKAIVMFTCPLLSANVLLPFYPVHTCSQAIFRVAAQVFNHNFLVFVSPMLRKLHEPQCWAFYSFSYVDSLSRGQHSSLMFTSFQEQGETGG